MSARAGPRSFDPVVLGHRETDAWAAYYRRDWRRVLVAAVGLVSAGFGMGRTKTVIGAFHVLRANQLWAPYPHNDPQGARSSMRRFYALVAKDHGARIDPSRAAELEVAWWRLHREHQHGHDLPERPLVAALVDLYAYVYAVPAELVVDAACGRVEAMDLSDRWVKAGRNADDELLDQVRRALVASYSSLLAAVAPD